MPYCNDCKRSWPLAKTDVEGVSSMEELSQLELTCPSCGSKETALGKRDRKSGRNIMAATQSPSLDEVKEEPSEEGA